MITSRSRLDRYLSRQLNINRRDVRLMLARGRIEVDDVPATSIHQTIDRFTKVVVDGQTLNQQQSRYLMLHKPKGVVSATEDDQHKTVVDLLPSEERHGLHIVGRLDFNTTGLILMTNDGTWSRRLTEPDSKVSKRYLVQLEKDITEECIAAFSEGIYFSYENIVTRPARLTRISDRQATVILHEGRYHQIKRMFSHRGNKVVELHREAIGDLQLDEGLRPGQWRWLSEDEVSLLAAGSSCSDAKGLNDGAK